MVFGASGSGPLVVSSARLCRTRQLRVRSQACLCRMEAGRWAGDGPGRRREGLPGRGRSAVAAGRVHRGRCPARGPLGKRTAGRVQGLQLPQEQGRSRRRRSTCQGRNNGHGLALRHGLLLTESVLRAAAAAHQIAGFFQSIPATRMRCRVQHAACACGVWTRLGVRVARGRRPRRRRRG